MSIYKDMKTILALLRNFLVILGICFFLLLLAGGVMLAQFEKQHRVAALPENITLTLNLAQPMEEYVPPLLRAVMGEDAPPTVREWVSALQMAAEDRRVTAVYIRAVGGSVTLTQAEELRGSIAAVRAAHKPVIFFTDTFGEMDNGTAMTYFAAAADKIILQPGGFAGFTGIGIQQPFFREFFIRNGILPEFEKRRDYKTAMDNLTESSMTAANREETTRLVEQLSGNVMNAVAKDRKMNLAVLANLRDTAPLPAGAAGALIDGVQYEDQIELPAEKITLSDYFNRMELPKPGKNVPKIALVDASGMIVRGKAEGGSPLSEKMIGAEDFAATLGELQENKDIRAVIIRLNSPGGSAIASETIFRAIENLKAAGKPVIISMTDVAASGGYYMAAPATKILALPSTLTGSIGVIVGKISAGELSRQYGVHWEEVTAGQNAAMFGMGRGFSDSERAAVVRSADAVYDTFKSRVGAARKLSPDAVEALAQGRVWTGAEAKEMGLVDEVGGLVEAVDAARTELHLAKDAPSLLVPYPDENSPFLFVQLLLQQVLALDSTSFFSFLAGKISSELKVRTLQMPIMQLQY